MLEHRDYLSTVNPGTEFSVIFLRYCISRAVFQNVLYIDSTIPHGTTEEVLQNPRWEGCSIVRATHNYKTIILMFRQT